jgi:hypothetical protein
VPRIALSHDERRVLVKRPDRLGSSKKSYRRKRIIMLVRDPRDVIVSAYFQATRRKRVFNGSLREYLPQIDTLLEYLNVWAAQRHAVRDFLLVRYEELSADPAGQLRRVMAFLGVRDLEPQHIEEAVRFAKFENMRALEASGALPGALRPTNSRDPESFKTRRGRVGGYVEYLSSSDVAYVESRMSERLDGFYGYPQ